MKYPNDILYTQKKIWADISFFSEVVAFLKCDVNIFFGHFWDFVLQIPEKYLKKHELWKNGLLKWFACKKGSVVFFVIKISNNGVLWKKFSIFKILTPARYPRPGSDFGKKICFFAKITIFFCLRKRGFCGIFVKYEKLDSTFRIYMLLWLECRVKHFFWAIILEIIQILKRGVKSPPKGPKIQKSLGIIGLNKQFWDFFYFFLLFLGKHTFWPNFGTIGAFLRILRGGASEAPPPGCEPVDRPQVR